MIRRTTLSLFSTILLAHNPATARDVLDPSFEKVPFAKWLNEPPTAGFRWKTSITRAELTFHERLAASVDVTIDGADLDKLRNKGVIVVLTQITDESGVRYQHHGVIELNRLDANVKAASIELSQTAFFAPGQYQLAVLVFDSETGEHAAAQMPFKVASPASDFLASAWRGLPAVEFIDSHDSPESWYLPEIQGKLKWMPDANSAPPLNVVLNIASSAPRSSPSGGLPALLPTLKLFAGGNGSLSGAINILDLNRQHAVFSQGTGADLDWPRLKSSLKESNTASIDVGALSQRKQIAQFFVSEIRRILRQTDKPGVLVVLSTPVDFESGEDLSRISEEALPATRVFYIRYHATLAMHQAFAPALNGRGRGGRFGGPAGRGVMTHEPIDRLAGTLKPLHPKIFDMGSPQELVKVLKEIRESVAGEP